MRCGFFFDSFPRGAPSDPPNRYLVRSATEQQPRLVALHLDDMLKRFELSAETLGDLSGGVEFQDKSSR